MNASQTNLAPGKSKKSDFLGAQIELLMSILRRAIKRAPTISINEGLYINIS